MDQPHHHGSPGVISRVWYRRGSTWAVLVTVTSAVSWWMGGW
jgi:hypothetical protein